MKKLFIFMFLIISNTFSMQDPRDPKGYYLLLKNEYRQIDLKEAENISPTVDQSIIDRACRRVKAKYHPQRSVPGLTKDEQAEMFQKISDACDVLSDPDKRKEYNQGIETQQKGLSEIVQETHESLLERIKKIINNAHILFDPIQGTTQQARDLKTTLSNYFQLVVNMPIERLKLKFISEREDEQKLQELKLVAYQLLNILNQQPSSAPDKYFNVFNTGINKIRPENINNADQLNRALQNLNTLSTLFELELYIDQRMQNKLIDTYINSAQKAKELNLEDKLQEIFTIIENKRTEWGALGKIDQALLNRLNTLRKVSPLEELRKAALSGDLDKVKKYVDQIPQIDVEKITFELAAKTSIDAQAQNTAIIAYATILAYLIDKKKLDPNLIDIRENKTLLMIAAEKGALEIVNTLLRLKQFKENINKGIGIRTALDFAQESPVDKQSKIETLRQAGAKTFAELKKEQIENEFLKKATKPNEASLDFMKLNINLVDQNIKNEALWEVVDKTNDKVTEIIELLLTNNASGSYKKNDISVLKKAVSGGNLDIVQILYNHLKIQTDIPLLNQEEKTALDVAIENNFNEIAELLKKAGIKSSKVVSAEPALPTTPADLTNISNSLQDLKEKLDALSSTLKKT